MTASTLGAQQDKKDEEQQEKLKGVDYSKVEADIAAAKQTAAQVNVCWHSIAPFPPPPPPHHL